MISPQLQKQKQDRGRSMKSAIVAIALLVFSLSGSLKAQVVTDTVAVQMVVHGTGFVPGTVVVVNGQDLVTTYASPTSLAVSLPLSLVSGGKISARKPPPPPPPCTQNVLNTPLNKSIASQAVPFTFTFDATPSQAAADGVVGLSLGAITGFSGLAVIPRFSAAGVIDARNAATYSADSVFPYVGGAPYHFRVTVDPVGKTYSVYVAAPAGTEKTIASNYGYRTEQVAALSLNNWAILSDVGTIKVCNAVISPGIAPLPPAPVHSVNLNWVDPDTGVTFNVKRGTTLGGPYAQVAGAIASNVKAYKDTAVQAGASYFYVITATNPNGESAPSNEVGAVIPKP